MPKSRVSSAKATGKATLQMIGLTGSSGQEVADGYGPSIQKSELLADAKSLGYLVDPIRGIIEPATIELEERDLFNAVMGEAVRLRQCPASVRQGGYQQRRWPIGGSSVTTSWSSLRRPMYQEEAIPG